MAKAKPKTAPTALDKTVRALERRVHELEERLGDTLRARRFELLDDGGGVRGVLSACGDAGEPSLTLADAEGRPRLDLSLDVDGTPTVHLYDADGAPAMTLRERTLVIRDRESGRALRMAVDSGAATLRFADGSGTVRAVVGVLGEGADEGPLVCLEPAAGSDGVALHVESDGLEIVNPRDGAPRARLRVIEDRNPVLVLFRDPGEDGTAPGVVLGVHGDGEPAIDLHHDNGEVAASVAVAPDGTPALTLKTTDGALSTSVTGAGRNGAEVLFWRGDGSVAATFGLGPSEAPVLQLLDRDSRQRVRVAMDGIQEFAAG